MLICHHTSTCKSEYLIMNLWLGFESMRCPMHSVDFLLRVSLGCCFSHLGVLFPLGQWRYRSKTHLSYHLENWWFIAPLMTAHSNTMGRWNAGLTTVWARVLPILTLHLKVTAKVYFFLIQFKGMFRLCLPFQSWLLSPFHHWHVISGNIYVVHVIVIKRTKFHPVPVC